MMHRRGGNKFRGGNSNNRFHDDHDNRSNNFIKTSRRVSFKTTKNNNTRSLNDMKIKAFLDDEDMGNDVAQNTSGDLKKKGRFRNRKGSPLPNRRIGGMNLIQNHAGWYLITIHHGSKYERDVLLKLLTNALLPTVFNAHYYKIDTENSCAQFYVDDYDVAAKILAQDKKINLPDGFKMIIRVKGSVPHVKVDEALKERMKLAMVKRYNQQTKALDLTKFHSDQDLSDVFCALFRPQIMCAVIDIIVENIPDLEALNLNENKLNMFDHLKILSSKLLQLKIIYLANNRIGSLSSLDIFKNLPIVELYLEGNPFKKRFAKNGDYVSEVKKKFPKLLKLDGVDLGPSIGFDVSEEKKDFPIWKQSFLVNSSGQDFVAKFLEQYFAIYDSDNRQQLLEAYHENAMLSITSTNNQHYTYEERLHAYWKVGRNLIHPKGYEHRFSSLKRGKLVVVALLSDLPPTKHDPQSFAVDLTFYTPQMIVMTVTGLYKEKNSDQRNDFFRTFQKTLVIVPNNGGFCIRNELLHINNASPAQARNAFKSTLSTIASQQINSSFQSSTAPQSPQIDDTNKMKMIEMMSQQSNMNVEWSKKCLEETQWDFNRALYVFQELFKENKIPQEAFVK